MRVRYFSEFFMYFFKVLPINVRGLGKISVCANVPHVELIVPVLRNQN